MGESLRNALTDVVTFLPKLLLALIILAIGWFIAKALEKLLVKVLEKVGFDRAVERGGIRKALQNTSYDASQILAKIVFYAVMLFVLSTAFGVFGPNPISDYLAAIIGYLPKVFVAILILVIAAAIAAGVKLLVQNALGSLSYARVLAGAASTVVLALGVIAALDQLQIAQNVVNAVLYAALVAIVGVVVVAVGGGGIVPMRQRWENALSKVEAEAPNLRREAQAARPASEVLRAEGERLAAERAEADRARQQEEQARREAEQAEARRQAEQRAEAERMDAERAEAERAAAQQAAAAQAAYHPTESYDPQQLGRPDPTQSAYQQPAYQEPGYQQRPESPGYGSEPPAEQYAEGYPEQYGQPQPWSTGAGPDPQQAYDRPPVPADEPYDVQEVYPADEPHRTDEPGTAQLPRITDDTPPPDDDRR